MPDLNLETASLEELEKVVTLMQQTKAVDLAGKAATKVLINLAQLYAHRIGDLDTIERFDHTLRGFIKYLEQLFDEYANLTKEQMIKIGWDDSDDDDDE